MVCSTACKCCPVESWGAPEVLPGCSSSRSDLRRYRSPACSMIPIHASQAVRTKRAKEEGTCSQKQPPVKPVVIFGLQIHQATLAAPALKACSSRRGRHVSAMFTRIFRNTSSELCAWPKQTALIPVWPTDKADILCPETPVGFEVKDRCLRYDSPLPQSGLGSWAACSKSCPLK